MGSLTGLSTSPYALGSLSLPALARPALADFAWTVPLAIAIALLTFAAKQLGLRSQPVAMRRPFVLIPMAGIVVAGLAIAFHAISGRSPTEVLFSGQSALPGLVSNPGAWSISALLLLLAFKGIAWGVSLGSFRGGPTFPAMLIGAAAGLLAPTYQGSTSPRRSRSGSEQM